MTVADSLARIRQQRKHRRTNKLHCHSSMLRPVSKSGHVANNAEFHRPIQDRLLCRAVAWLAGWLLLSLYQVSCKCALKLNTLRGIVSAYLPRITLPRLASSKDSRGKAPLKLTVKVQRRVKIKGNPFEGIPNKTIKTQLKQTFLVFDKPKSDNQ